MQMPQVPASARHRAGRFLLLIAVSLWCISPGHAQTLSPTSISFSGPPGGPFSPTSQNVRVNGCLNAFIEALPVDWLGVSTSGGECETPSGVFDFNFSVTSAANQLPPGSYSGSVEIFGGALNESPFTLFLPVTLTVLAPAPTVSIVATRDAAEPDVNGEFTVSLAQPVAEPATIRYSVGGSATPGVDYQALPGSIVIPAGQTTATIPVVVIDDDLIEGDETVVLTLTGGSYTIGSANGSAVIDLPLGSPTSATVVIIDDDEDLPPSCTISSPAGDVTISAGQSVAFSGSVNDAEDGLLTPQWTFPGGNPGSSNAESVSVTYPETGEFTATLRGTDSSGQDCPPASRRITVVAAPNNPPICTIVSPAGDQRITVGDRLNFAGVVTDPDSDAVAVGWSISPKRGVDFDATRLTNPTLGEVGFSEPGTYVFDLNATDARGAPCAFDRVTVMVEADDTAPTLQVTISANRTSIDTGETVNFTSTITPAAADASLSWLVSPETGVTPASGNQPTFSPRFDSPGNFRVTLQAALPGRAPVTSNSIDIVVREVSPIRVSIRPPAEPPITGQSSSFSADISGLPAGVTPSFAWSISPGDGVIPGPTNQATFSPRFIVPGPYTVTLRVITNGQETTDSVVIEVGGEVNANALTPLTQPGTPQAAIAQTIDRICPDPNRTLSGTLQADCDAMIDAALSGDSAQATAAVNAITPDAVNALKNDALASIGLQAINIAGRLTALRTGAGGFSTAGLNIDLDGTRISGRQMQSLVEALSGGAASADDSGFSRLGVFVSGTLASGDRDRTANSAGFDYDVYGLTIGVDYRVNDNLILGGALGYSSTDADVNDDRGTLDADSYSVTFYGSYYQTDNFFIDGSLSYGRSDYDQERRVRYTLPDAAVNQGFFSSFDGDQFGVNVGAGYELRFAELLVVPTARLQYIRATIDAYSEDRASNPGEAGSGLNVEIDEQTYRSFALGLGGQVSYAVSQPWGVLLPYASLEYVHDFEKNDSAVTGRFVNDDPTVGRVTFELPVDSRDQNYFNLGIGASAQFTNGTAGFINYERLLGYSDLSQYRINAGLRFEF